MAFDFSTVVAPFRMQPGLRRLADGEHQLTPLSIGDPALREKLAVLSAYPGDALVGTAGFDARPALAGLAAHAAAEHADAFECRGDDTFHAPRLGWTLSRGALEGDGPAEIGVCLRALPDAWRLPGLLSLAFAEDFALIDGASGRIPWLAVCLPSNWAPDEKVGRHFAEVHAPVADNATLLAASAHLIRLVTGIERWERFVWTLTDSPRLHRHPRRIAASAWDPTLDADALAAATFFRTERQTFIPLPELGQAVFTIHVETTPLVAALASAAAADRLHAALGSMSPAVLAYRGLGAPRERLLAWLAARASGGG
jgi:hypothetical protein